MSPHGVVKRYADIFLYHCLWGGQIIGGYKLWGDTNYEGIQKFHKLIRNSRSHTGLRRYPPPHSVPRMPRHIPHWRPQVSAITRASRACHATSRTGVRRYPPPHGHPAHATPYPARASAGIRHHTGIPRMPHPAHATLYPARASAGRRFDSNRVHRSAAEVCPEWHTKEMMSDRTSVIVRGSCISNHAQ